MPELSGGNDGVQGEAARTSPGGDPEGHPIVLVTGAGRGIGRAAAIALGARGAVVCVNDINPDSAHKIAHETAYETAHGTAHETPAGTGAQIGSTGSRSRVYLADVSKKFPVQAMFNAVEDDWERVDAVVHCAAVMPRRPLLEMDEWEWRRVLDVNLTGAFNVIQIAGRLMETYGGGVIVLAVETPADPTHLGAVEAARHGLLGLAAAAKAELSEAGIRVEAVVYGEGDRDRAVEKIVSLITSNPAPEYL